MELKGIDQARELFWSAIDKGYPVTIKGDPDVDGMLAYCVASQMLDEKGIKYHSTVNRDRKHGLVEDELNQNGKPKGVDPYFHENELIINVDSSISGDELMFLAENGNIVISLDHHKVELDGYDKLQRHFKKGEGECILINNQFEDEPEEWRFWSGTGVVIHALSKILNVGIKTEWTVMHGITLLSDVRDIENDLAREILKVTYSTPLKDMRTLNRLVKKTQLEVPDLFRKEPEHLDRTFIDYSFSPYYNACYQLNLSEYIFTLLKRSLPYNYSAKTDRKAIVENLEKYVKVTELKNLTILGIELDAVEPIQIEENYSFSYSNFLGLLANKYLSLGKTVAILSRENGKFKRGSVRALSHHIDYNAIFSKYGFTCKGHTGAFGITALNNPKFKAVSKEIGIVEVNEKAKPNFKTAKNLLAMQEELLQIADDNQYVLSQNKLGIYYTGFHCSVKRETKGTMTYEVDGMSVRTFDKELTLENSLIIPTLECDNLILTLEKLNN